MTNFNSGDPGSGNSGEVTNFNADGSANNSANAQTDQSVVMEHDGRQLTKAEIAAILKRDAHAQAHIAKMEQDAKALRDQLAAAPKVDAEALLKQIKEGLTPAAVVPGAAPATITVEDVANEVAKRQEQAQAAAQQEANWKEVTQTLTNAYGAATQKKVEAAAAEAGLTLDAAAKLARSNPKLFLKLFPDVKPKAVNSPLPNRGQSNTQSFQGTPTGSKKLHELTGTKERVNALQARYKELGL